MPPWATGTWQQRQEEMLYVVDAKWFQVVTQYEYLYNAPVVKDTYYDEEQGNLWMCVSEWDLGLIWGPQSRAQMAEIAYQAAPCAKS